MAALRTELSKMNFMSKLRDKLQQQEQKLQSRTTPGGTSSKNEESPLWKMTEQFLQSRKQTIPIFLNNIFWNLILASTSPKSISSTTTGATNPKKKLKKKLPSVEVRKDHIAILMKARERAVKEPIFWHHKHKHEELRLFLEASAADDSSTTTITVGPSGKKKRRIQKDILPEYRAKRSISLTQIHYGKDEKKIHEEAKEITHYLRAHLPPAYYQKLLSTLEEYGATGTPSLNDDDSDDDDEADLTLESDLSTETTSTVTSTVVETKTTRQQRSKIQQLYANPIHACVRTHSSWIAPALVEFFYLTISTATVEEEPLDEVNGEPEKQYDIIPADVILSTDAKIQSSRDDWKDAQDEFVRAFQTVQALLVNEHESMLEQNGLEGILDGEEDSAQQMTRDIELDDNDDMMEESVMSSFQEASRVPEGNVSKEESELVTLLFQPKKYIAFEAISVHDLGLANMVAVPRPPHLYSVVGEGTVKSVPSTEVENENVAELEAPSDRLVFIDNLPIDVSVQTLTAAYSRCGAIDDITIFHRREDLDPGRRSDDGKKKVRRPSSASRRSWERPRTPLYATILYRENTGALKATQDPLRIFGMVVDHHLIRSHRAGDMTSLYIENISPKLDVSAIEYELSQILHPRLYVCLDIDRRRQKGLVGQPNAVIQFPDFESAYWAHSRLSQELMRLSFDDTILKTAVHWMPTPRDAMLYWTRKLNF